MALVGKIAIKIGSNTAYYCYLATTSIKSAIVLAENTVCTSTSTKPLLLNNLINSASPHGKPLLHQEVFQELNPLSPLRMSIVLSNGRNEIHIETLINPEAVKFFLLMAYQPSHIRPG